MTTSPCPIVKPTVVVSLGGTLSGAATGTLPAGLMADTLRLTRRAGPPSCDARRSGPRLSEGAARGIARSTALATTPPRAHHAPPAIDCSVTRQSDCSARPLLWKQAAAPIRGPPSSRSANRTARRASATPLRPPQPPPAVLASLHGPSHPHRRHRPASTAAHHRLQISRHSTEAHPSPSASPGSYYTRRSGTVISYWSSRRLFVVVHS